MTPASSGNHDYGQCRGVPRGYPFLPTLEIGPEDARDALSGKQGKSPLLIDCRREDEFAAVALPESILIPLDELAARTEEVEQALRKRGDAKTDPLLIICHHGRRSLHAANTLKAAGFEGARSVVGGLELWSQVIDPAVPRYDKTFTEVWLLKPRQQPTPGTYSEVPDEPCTDDEPRL